MLEWAIVAVVVFVFRIGLNNRVTSDLTFKAYLRFMKVNNRTPEWWPPIQEDVDYNLQGDLATKFGLSICRYCRWVITIEGAEIHSDCIAKLSKTQEDTDREIDAAWDAYEAQLAEIDDDDEQGMPWDYPGDDESEIDHGYDSYDDEDLDYDYVYDNIEDFDPSCFRSTRGHITPVYYSQEPDSFQSGPFGDYYQPTIVELLGDDDDEDLAADD